MASPRDRIVASTRTIRVREAARIAARSGASARNGTEDPRPIEFELVEEKAAEAKAG
jgi:hypothetical protein